MKNWVYLTLRWWCEDNYSVITYSYDMPIDYTWYTIPYDMPDELIP